MMRKKRLAARRAAYRHSPEGRDRARMLKLMFKGRRLTVDEQDELDRLKAHYPDPKDSRTPKPDRSTQAPAVRSSPG